ncbi:hypothetical protein CYMTET_45564 [Cymbomonas tetramitiformis]|uniref:Malic enzyme n=1 Tax=Cymbomonas tetramitiformis TaxID=36881 RepID=A0AAE0EZK4_9CHLO|nr:hypothetical protein CYMTET_45564 [Cymbomonas tetramitiformis]|eukprot:gene1512-2146_t
MLDADHIHALRAIDADINKYLYLRRLRLDDPNMYYRLLLLHSQELMPFVYTPTVGEACKRYGELNIQTWGLYITKNDRGKILDKLHSFTKSDIRVIVVTDGERILGIGDWGAGGMGISEGKILLYTVIAGVPPSQCLPICLDVGTNNDELLSSSSYRGLRERRLRGAAYDDLIGELFSALKARWPHTTVQFEDFGNANAFRLLDTFRPKHCCFNDDIQGTACITLAGVLAGLRLCHSDLTKQRVLFLGAGEAGTGIGELLSLALVKRHGLTLQQARAHCYFMDSKGLVCSARENLQHHKQPFAHSVPFARTLVEAVRQLRPTILIGVSTIPAAFTREIVELMAEYNDRPMIFPLSNPTHLSECSYADAFHWTGGRVIFASGSPFPPLQAASHGQLTTFHPAQANNAYAFPSIGFAASLTKCRSITDDVFLVAAEAISQFSKTEDLARGLLFPSFDNIQEISVALSSRCAEFMCANGLGDPPTSGFEGSWEPYVRSQMYKMPMPSQPIHSKL